MKKLILMLTAVTALTFATPGYVYAQDDVGLDPVEVVIPDDTSSVEITDEGDLITVPDVNDDVTLPGVPWGMDFNAYLANIWVYIATILAITQLLKKVLNWVDNKAFWLSVGIAAAVTALGYFLKLGMFSIMEWWHAIAWFLTAILGSKYGYKLMVEIITRLGVPTKTT